MIDLFTSYTTTYTIYIKLFKWPNLSTRDHIQTASRKY